MMLLKQARMSKGLTQGQLAELAETTQAVISYIENGRRFPTAATRKKVEAVLGMPIYWIGTRLEGPIKDNFEEGLSSEDRVIKAIYVYVKTAPFRERPERFRFLREFLDAFERNLGGGGQTSP